MKPSEDCVRVQCDCGCMIMEIGDLWDDKMYLSFWVQAFMEKQDSCWDRLKTKLKLLWKVITKGDYFLHELIIDKGDIKNIKEYLDKF